MEKLSSNFVWYFWLPSRIHLEEGKDEGLKVDHASRSEMERQRERACSARSKETSMGVQSALLTDIKVESKLLAIQ